MISAAYSVAQTSFYLSNTLEDGKISNLQFSEDKAAYL